MASSRVTSSPRRTSSTPAGLGDPRFSQKPDLRRPVDSGLRGDSPSANPMLDGASTFTGCYGYPPGVPGSSCGGFRFAQLRHCGAVWPGAAFASLSFGNAGLLCFRLGVTVPSFRVLAASREVLCRVHGLGVIQGGPRGDSPSANPMLDGASTFKGCYGYPPGVTGSSCGGFRFAQLRHCGAVWPGAAFASLSFGFAGLLCWRLGVAVPFFSRPRGFA